MGYEMGEQASISRHVGEGEVAGYAEMFGDFNPVHFDASFAATTRFGRPIVHGMFAANMIATVLGMSLPGPGTVYLGQTLKFLAPVYVGDTLTATLKVVEVNAAKSRVTLSTVVTKQDDTAVLTGEALVMVQELSA